MSRRRGRGGRQRQDKRPSQLSPKPVVLDTPIAYRKTKTCTRNVISYDTAGSLLPCLGSRDTGRPRTWGNNGQEPGRDTTMGKGLHTPAAQPPDTCPPAGTSMILGVLFYLLQAREFLQEGMTYSLGRSFYLAWIGIFFFLAIGLSWDGVGFGPGPVIQRGRSWG